MASGKTLHAKWSQTARFKPASLQGWRGYPDHMLHASCTPYLII